MTFRSNRRAQIPKRFPLPRGIAAYVTLLLAGLAVGLGLGLLLRPSVAPEQAGLAAPQAARVEALVQRLETDQRQLKSEVADLRKELARRQEQAASTTDRLGDVQDELARQRLLAGLVPVEGPGVMVTLDDSAVRVPLGADASTYLIHEYDLRDIANLLWMAGSEGVAINGERLVASSSIYCVGSTVLVNDTRLSPPYTIRAIGNPRVQQDYLRNPSYLAGLKDKKRQYGLRFDVAPAASVTLPAYGGSILIRHARPGE